LKKTWRSVPRTISARREDLLLEGVGGGRRGGGSNEKDVRWGESPPTLKERDAREVPNHVISSTKGRCHLKGERLAIVGWVQAMGVGEC